MKHSIFLLFMIFTTLLTNGQSQGDSYDNLWAKVFKLETENLTKSALELVAKIKEKAEKEDKPTQQIKTLLFTAKYTLILEEDAKLRVVKELQSAIENAEAPVSNVLESYLANLYWQYFKQNRYLFYNRTETEQKVDTTDFRTWDLSTLFKEVGIHFENSLQRTTVLKASKIGSFKEILDYSAASDNFRPTLFDLLSHNALEFYKSTESTINKPLDNYKATDRELFCDAVQFAELQLPRPTALSLQLKALKTYQALVAFHLNDAQPDALVAIDLERLQYLYSTAVVPEKQRYYLENLKNATQRYNNQEVAALYHYEIARVYQQQGNSYKHEEGDNHQWKLKEALQVCDEVIFAYPESRGAKKCEVLKKELLRKDLELTVESFQPKNTLSKLLVTYRNYSALQFTAHKINEKGLKKLQELYEREQQLAYIEKLPIVTSWDSPLRDEGDYQSHSIEVTLPALPNGNYLILARPGRSNEKEKTSFAYSTVQMTNLSLSQRRTDNAQLFQVTNRNNGIPISNAKLTISYRKNYRGNTAVKTLATDTNGFAAFPLNNSNYRVLSIQVVHGKETALFGNTYINAKTKKQAERIRYQTFFFLDRSIYRPGQVVFFKGIVVEHDGKESKPATRESVNTILRNTNDEKIAELDFETNEYGSFSGEFVLPSSGLNGQYRLEVNGSSNLINDSHYFSVEEYKRPKFKTSFSEIAESYKLNDSVTVTGKANSYAGSPITNAKVKYRVQRNVNYPGWFYWRRPYVYSEPQEIAQGETVSKADGSYDIRFKAAPDIASKKEDLPVFNYTVYADVTDINGETRSTSTIVNVGYHSIEASISIPSKLEKTTKGQKLGIRTQNLNGQAVATKGSLSIYKLVGPDAVLRPRPWPAPDYKNWDKETFRNYYPHEAYANELDSNQWPKGTLTWETTFDTEKRSEIPLPNIKNWESGQYLIELETKDPFGQVVIAKTRTTLFTEKEKTLADNQLFDIRTNKTTYEIGDSVEVSFYSNAENLGISYWVEKGNRIVKKGWIALKKGCESIQIPVTENDLGGFAINYSYSVFNSFQSGSMVVSVPYPSTDLEITTKTFRNKIAPGTEESWSFSIKGPKKEKVTSELLASMYDASLDQFRGHYWSFYPIQRSYYYAVAHANANFSFGTQRFNVYHPNQGTSAIPVIPQSSLEWFGLSFGNAYWAQQRYLNKQRAKLRDSSSYSNEIPKGMVQGVIYDDLGQPLPGVSVVIKGTSQGSTTDFDGKFSIAIKEGQTLVFSYIGYSASSLKVRSDNFYNIHLSEDSSRLDEVVVTGYGRESKRRNEQNSLAVRSVSEDILEAEADVAYSLAGNASGLPAPQSSPSNQGAKEEVDFGQVTLRKNLRETAFFFPHLRTDKEGTVSFTFTSPEALTQWKLQLLAHTKDLKHGSTSFTTITQKELMVLPNPPRFLREGDTIHFSTKIANLSNKELQGSGQLTLMDATTGEPLDTQLGNLNKTRKFTVDASGNTQLSWSLAIPEGLQAVTYKVLAKAGNYSDGEEGFLPVLTNRTLVTETLPMWVRSDQTKTFTLEKLRDNTSTTLKHHKLSLEITSNPAWYAVQALPYLMEYPYECNEQTFARYYANSLATYIANSNPRIQEVFQQWRNSDALLSNLEKNQELKSILIEETPWLRDAQSETEQKKRIALLFDLNRMRNQQQQSLRKLKANQLSSGAWPWFKGGRGNRHITQHIITGLGHLQKLTGKEFGDNTQIIVEKALRYLDAEFVKEYEQMKKYNTDISKDHLSAGQVHYLYMRSFFPEIKTSKKVDGIKSYYLEQAGKYWSKRSLYSQGLLALLLHRNAMTKTAQKIIRALRENSITSDELGMYWKANTSSWSWYQAPIATQSLLIEAFAEIDGDLATLDNLKIWLLKNKQTNQWKTTKATTTAVYALLFQGSDWLSVTDAVSVLVGGEALDERQLETVKVEAGTGYYKTAWTGTEIEPKMGTVQLNKKGKGIAWGALYWQYFEDLEKIEGADTPLQLKKELFLTSNTNTGEVLRKITPNTKLKLGDLVRVRIALRSDRDMEFLHMKDMRASGMEPVNVLSQYKWQDGLGYYESTKDASTNFFFDYLKKGIYIFEYDLRVNNIGDFSNGITTIQSMYAPEYSSHSNGTRVVVTE